MSWRSAATASGVARSPSMAEARSPRRSAAVKNGKRLTTSSTGSRWESRCRTKSGMSATLFEPGRRDVDHAVVELRQSLNFGLGDGVVRVLECPEPDSFAVDQTAHRTVVLDTLCFIRRYAG